MDFDTSKVVEKIKPDYDNPNEYDELVDAWSKLCEQAQTATNDDLNFAEIEKAAITALSLNQTEQPEGHIGHDVSRLLNSFDYPTYLVTSQGNIAASNLCAWKEFKLNAHDPIDNLPFRLDASEKISSAINKKLQHNTTDPDSALVLKRTHANDGQQDATIAITVSLGNPPSALVFVITTQWKTQSVDLLKKQFGLSKAEAEILIYFVDGYSSQDIAELRKRSHQTVRAQLQSIREKLGAKNQTELLRTTLSVSDFAKNIGSISNTIEHPHRRKSENIRAGGRVVEATLMGDFSGDPIVTIAAISQYTYNAEFEKMLFDANLLLISVCPPGYGKTDPTPNDMSWFDQAREDVLAVLDQLSIPKCVLLIKYTNAPMSYYIARRHQSRFIHIVQLSTSGPAQHYKPSNEQSHWFSGMIKASMSNSAIAGVLIKGGIKSWVVIGAKQFIRLQLISNQIDKKYALRPENVVESQHALDTATQRGIGGAAQEFACAFKDWTADIEAVQLNMTFIHGSKNKLYSIESVRSLAASFPDKARLIEIKNAGFTVVNSHPEKVIEILRSVVDFPNCVSDQLIKARA